MIRKLVSAGAVAALLASTPVNAAVTVITFLDGTSGSHNGAFALDAGSNAYALGVICGGAAAALGTTVAQCAEVNSSGQILTLSPVNTWAGGTLGAMANYGTSPGAVLAPGVNAFVTNTNPNGQAVAASSSPVVLPSAQVTADPCALGVKTNLPISTNATALTQIIAVSSTTKIYICSVNLVAPGATAFNLVRGTGTNCATGTPTAVMGSTTAANGMSLAANGGFTLGNGAGTVGSTNASDELCTLQSNAVQVAGNLTYVQQ